MTEIASLVLFATDADKTTEFYRSIGPHLAYEHHGEGPVHFATELGGVHFAIYQADQSGRAPRATSSTSIDRRRRWSDAGIT